MARTRTAASRISELAARPAVRGALAWLGRNVDRLGAAAVAVAEIPAPTFHERARAEYVAHELAALGLHAVEIGTDGNVYALLPGSAAGSRPALAVFAHLDTVFGADVDLTVSRRDGRLYAPGIGDNS